jgi:23S rRNA (guanosine2251-2'-O)-methyltransferase
MNKLVVIIHDVRSCHNVGSILRSADGFGVDKVYLTGYTPYPLQPNDKRLPHISQKMERQINKTALGAQNNVSWKHFENIVDLLNILRSTGYLISALEQTKSAQKINSFQTKQPLALIVGSETTGLSPEIIKLTDIQLEIPMLGQKESFNVAVAAGIALYHLSYKA